MDKEPQDFWQMLDALVAESEVVIDRPAGSFHPRYPAVRYPLDYGYLCNTCSMDGAGIDVWVGSLPGRTVTAAFCTVDRVKRDSEIKLLLGCTPAEKQCALAFHRDNGQGVLLIERP
ncbi:MAG: inorganic pyrophosphatase [Anaerolineae bacterium]|jgi:inorganic pyrophosphatase|nr:inorganic pyrophosphatase [Anaerolineae bacterium]